MKKDGDLCLAAQYKCEGAHGDSIFMVCQGTLNLIDGLIAKTYACNKCGLVYCFPETRR